MKFFHWISLAMFGTTVATSAEEGNKVAPAELQIETTFMPAVCEPKAKTGDHIDVHYTGTLFTTRKKFDASYDRGRPLPLTLGVGQVIKGWDQGLQGMCLNEKRTLTIPAHLAYGEKGFGNVIPPNSVLVFEVELVGLKVDQDHQEL